MTIYVGETVGISVSFTNPLTKQPITDGTGKLELFAPPKNPATVIADRATVDQTVALLYNPATSQWEAQVDTTGYGDGIWRYRATHSGAFNAWDFFSFTLAP